MGRGIPLLRPNIASSITCDVNASSLASSPVLCPYTVRGFCYSAIIKNMSYFNPVLNALTTKKPTPLSVPSSTTFSAKPTPPKSSTSSTKKAIVKKNVQPKALTMANPVNPVRSSLGYGSLAGVVSGTAQNDSDKKMVKRITNKISERAVRAPTPAEKKKEVVREQIKKNIPALPTNIAESFIDKVWEERRLANMSFADKQEEKISKKYDDRVSDFGERYGIDLGGHNNEGDTMRHSVTAMEVSRDLGVPVANILGLAHEINAMMRSSQLPSPGIKEELKELGSDAYNNFIGSVIGSLPISKESQEKLLIYAKDKNILHVMEKISNEDRPSSKGIARSQQPLRRFNNISQGMFQNNFGSPNPLQAFLRTQGR